jgi:K+-sensing histidine kinase KdpD
MAFMDTKLSAFLSRPDRMIRQLRRSDLLIGTLTSTVAALVISLVAAGRRWEVFVPLMFSLVLLGTAARFGARAGMAATLAATLVFAVFLFSPRGSLRVGIEAERANLVWMMLMGTAFSFFFAPPNSGLRRS